MLSALIVCAALSVVDGDTFRLQEMIEGEKLWIEAKGKDGFGRPLPNVYLPNGGEVGKELIREGFARE